VRGDFLEASAIPAGTDLKDIHFPAERVSLEAVIRLLADQFGTPCHEAPEVWRPVLAASERETHQTADRSSPGPA
jgi:hypothetical protein